MSVHWFDCNKWCTCKTLTWWKTSPKTVASNIIEVRCLFVQWNNGCLNQKCRYKPVGIESNKRENFEVTFNQVVTALDRNQFIQIKIWNEKIYLYFIFSFRKLENGNSCRSLQTWKRIDPRQWTSTQQHWAKSIAVQIARTDLTSRPSECLFRFIFNQSLIKKFAHFKLQDKFAGVDIRVRVNGGGHVSQIYAIRQAISKALVAFYQKCKSIIIQ